VSRGTYIQVEVAEDASGKTRISLHDSRGTFMEAFSSPPESSGAAVEQSEVESRDDQEGDNENAESAEDEAYAALVEARARNMELQDLNNELLSQVSTLEGEVTMLADKLKIE
jgi:nitric oxide reductase activation protein